MSPLPTSDRVVHWETHRGRNNEFDKTEAGTAQIVLQNRDGLFDPLKADSIYTIPGNLLPMRQVTITANSPEHPTVWNPVFTGFIEGWEYTRRGPRHGQCTLSCVDGFEILQQAQVQPVKNSAQGGHFFPVQDVKDRIRAGLQFAGWPAARSSLFSGNVAVQKIIYPVGSSMLQVIQDAADAEFPGVANFYMDKRGWACFRGREFRLDPFNDDWDQPSSPPAGTASRSAYLYRFGDDQAIQADPTLLPIADLSWTFNQQHLYNWVTIIPAEWDERDYWKQQVTDSVLAKKYGKRDLTISGLLTYAGTAASPVQTAGQECRRFARYYLQNYKHPKVRANVLEVHSKFEDDRIWDFLLNVELSDVVELWTVNPGGGGFAGEQFYVDGIHNVVNAEGDWPEWVSTYDLSPRGHYEYFPPPFPIGG